MTEAWKILWTAFIILFILAFAYLIVQDQNQQKEIGVLEEKLGKSNKAIADFLLEKSKSDSMMIDWIEEINRTSFQRDSILTMKFIELLSER